MSKRAALNAQHVPNSTQSAGHWTFDEQEILKVQEVIENLYSALLDTTAEVTYLRNQASHSGDHNINASISLVTNLLLTYKNSVASALELTFKDGAGLQAQIEGLTEKLSTEMNRLNVYEICPKIGDPFDPSRHCSLVPLSGDLQAHSEPTALRKGPYIREVLRNGYALHDHVLSRAMVLVSD